MCMYGFGTWHTAVLCLTSGQNQQDTAVDQVLRPGCIRVSYLGSGYHCCSFVGEAGQDSFCLPAGSDSLLSALPLALPPLLKGWELLSCFR